jgi:hypothetical protein
LATCCANSCPACWRCSPRYPSASSAYHVVFTLPQQFPALALRNQADLYGLLFDCAAESLLEFARERLDGTPGITAVLHTWGQQLNYHPHLHCIITAGALGADGQDWSKPRQKRYLFPEAALSALFRGKFMAGLRLMEEHLRWPPGLRFDSLRWLYDIHWQVYLKRPFGGPQQALAYLANDTHRVALASSRLQRINPQAGTVTFSYRDYAGGNRIKSRELPGTEFLKRFCQHLLPRHFTRIRHYGILANNRRARDIPQVRLLLLSRRTVGLLVALHQPPPGQSWSCPCCLTGRMRIVRVARITPSSNRAPPP